MPDTEKYARTTISVPPALKEQMETVETSVNWSALACRAFEDKLAEIAAHKEKKDMKDIVTRLRASKRQAEDAHYKEGFEVGREWAEDTAEADDLQRLERFADWIRRDFGWDRFFTEGDVRSSYPSEMVAKSVWPKDDEDYVAENFWEQALGDDTSAKDDPSFVKGFVEGALALWDEVKDQL